ncbi:MAG: hydroxymethylbilane synthase [Ignavibacteriales bacterium]|nr:hydroxymethylbilane synthase [Ignavibacteriales bacterium]
MTRGQKRIIIGSRGSQLALWQAGFVKHELEKKFPQLQIEIETMKTTGDKILDSPLSKIGDKGLFTKENEHALLKHKIDLAVHSLKDLPTELPLGLIIGAITKREDVHDVFIKHPSKQYIHLEDVPHGGKIATGSLRRKCQLLNWRPDVEVIDLRGNLQTRFAKLEASDWDGMILARAGVFRLGLVDRITEVIPIERMLPAVGQGALGIEIRDDDPSTQKYVQVLASRAATVATMGERAFLRHLEGGCQVPIGAYGRIEDNEFFLDGFIGSLDGRKIARGKLHGAPDKADALGIQLAQSLVDSGGREILEKIRDPRTFEVPVI